MDNAKRIMNGTFGEVWLDGELVGESYGLQAKVSVNKEEVKICGQMAVDSKTTSVKMTGSLKLYKVNSRLVSLLGSAVRKGRDPRFTIISKLADPDAYGSERIVLRNVSFDDLTLADWEAAVYGKIEAPFTFTDFEPLDTVSA